MTDISLAAQENAQIQEISEPTPAATEPAVPRITRAEFTDQKAYMAPDETIRVHFETAGLDQGRTYTAKAVLTNVRGGISAYSGDEISSQTTFTPQSGASGGDIEFSLDTTGMPDRQWSAQISILDETGSEIVRTDTKLMPVTVLAPQMTVDTTQGIVDGSLVVSMVVKAKNLEPGREYNLTGSLNESTTSRPYERDGQKLTSESVICLTSDDIAYGVREASAEVVISVPRENVETTRLYPMVSLEAAGTEVASQRGGAILLTEGTTWYPGAEASASAAQAVSTVAPLELLEEETVEPQETQIPLLGTPTPSATAVPEKSRRTAAGSSGLVSGLCLIGGVCAVVWLVYRRMKKNGAA